MPDGQTCLLLVFALGITCGWLLLQVVVMALVAATLFLRTHIHPVSPNDGQEIAGFCFFATLVMLFNGIAELSMSVSCLFIIPRHHLLPERFCDLADCIQE